MKKGAWHISLLTPWNNKGALVALAKQELLLLKVKLEILNFK